jgi:hypothetical protein
MGQTNGEEKPATKDESFRFILDALCQATNLARHNGCGIDLPVLTEGTCLPSWTAAQRKGRLTRSRKYMSYSIWSRAKCASEMLFGRAVRTSSRRRRFFVD